MNVISRIKSGLSPVVDVISANVISKCFDALHVIRVTFFTNLRVAINYCNYYHYPDITINKTETQRNWMVWLKA
jgi:hypothetical protein